MPLLDKCPVCGASATQTLLRAARQVDCPRCGRFLIDEFTPEIGPLTPTEIAKLAGWIREHQGLIIRKEDIESAKNSAMPSVPEKADRILSFLARRHRTLGTSFVVDKLWNELLGITWAESTGEVAYILDDYLCTEAGRLAKTVPSQYREYRITPKGWAFLESLQRANQDAATVKASAPQDSKPASVEPATLRTASLTEWAGTKENEYVKLAIVFSDITGSTKLNEQLGNAAWSKVRSAHLGHARRLVEKHGGWYVKDNGDGVIAVFKSDVPALEYAMALEKNTGHEHIQIKCGVNSGEVEILQNDVLGNEVNLAARILGYTAAGGIRMSDVVHRAWVGRHGKTSLLFDKHPNIALQGVEDLHTLWSLPSVEASGSNSTQFDTKATSTEQNSTCDSVDDAFTIVEQFRSNSAAWFYNDRFVQAFPGVRGISEIRSAADAVERLSILLRSPLKWIWKDEGAIPIWWWRGLQNMPIFDFHTLSPTEILMGRYELPIRRVIAVNACAYWQAFVYVEIEKKPPIGIYEQEADRDSRLFKMCGYSWEEFGLY